MGESASIGRDHDRTETYQREPKNTAALSNCQYDTISEISRRERRSLETITGVRSVIHTLRRTVRRGAGGLTAQSGACYPLPPS